MQKDITLLEKKPTETLAVHPQKFIVWLFIISITMIFAGLTSAYLVKYSEGGWPDLILPSVLTWSTVLIVLSSVTMQMAYFATKKDNLTGAKLLITTTLFLGVFFLVLQVKAWEMLGEAGFYLEGHVAGSFLYILTGVHGFHLVTGLVFLIIVLISIFNYKVHSKKILRIGMCTTYWHFLTILWVYLFVFLKIYH